MGLEYFAGAAAPPRPFAAAESSGAAERAFGETLTDRFRDAMSRTAAGVVIVATDGPAGRAGATISSFSSLSLTPPSVLAALNGASATLRAVLANRVFSISALSETQAGLAQEFARSGAPRLFDPQLWGALETGAPLCRRALVAFDCRLAASFEYGSHMVLVGDVVALANGEGRPLAYSGRDYHRLDPLSARGENGA